MNYFLRVDWFRWYFLSSLFLFALKDANLFAFYLKENNTSRQLQRNVSFLSSKQQHKRATHRASPFDFLPFFFFFFCFVWAFFFPFSFLYFRSKNVVANKFGDSAFLQYDQQPPQPRKSTSISIFLIYNFS